MDLKSLKDKLTTSEPDWMRVMRVLNPDGPNKGRPRRLSLHTLTAVCGRDGGTILKEMEHSGKVVGYECPDVRTPIYYLIEEAKRPGMIDTRNEDCWERGRAWLAKYPTSEVKGFKKFPFYVYKGGQYVYDDKHVHKGAKTDSNANARYGCPDACYTMDVPFDELDAAYEKLVRAAVKGV